jgi:hypothetical protein
MSPHAVNSCFFVIDSHKTQIYWCSIIKFQTIVKVFRTFIILIKLTSNLILYLTHDIHQKLALQPKLNLKNPLHHFFLNVEN